MIIQDDLIAAEIIDRYTRDIGDPACPGGCLYWAAIAHDVINRHGVPVLFQAGTMMWPRLADHDTSEDAHTHFSYVYEGGVVCAGSLPEMHAWCVLPDTREVVDFTTGTFPAHCSLLIGKPWLNAPPPLYLWGHVPEGVVYHADPQAIRAVVPELVQAGYLSQSLFLERLRKACS